VEIEAFAVANLVAKMEEGKLDTAPLWTDIKTFDGKPFRGLVDILSGGFPCPPFSHASGENRKADQDPRHLFPSILNVIQDTQPRVVFLENVEGIISAKLKGDEWDDPAGTSVLLHVCRELERRGYKTTWGIFSAAEVGAPMQRKRVFICGVADPDNSGGQQDRLTSQLRASGPEQSPSHRWPSHEGEAPEGREEALANASSEGSQGRIPEREDSERQGEHGHAGRSSKCVPTRWPARPGTCQNEWEEPRVVAQKLRGDNPASAMGNAEGGKDNQRESRDLGEKEFKGSGGNAASGDASGWSIEPKLDGTTDGTTSGVDAIANRVDRLRLIGNGVVVDTASRAFATLIEELGG
jgi:DNA (cytosine-5)-methyltransferase 1